MTALPQQLGAAGSIDWSRWVPIDQAAQALDVSAGHLRRQAIKLQAQGLAMQAAPPQGGNPRWWIARQYDLRLGPGYAGQVHQAADLRPFSDKQRSQALARKSCVEALRHARRTRPGLMRDWLPHLIEQLKAQHRGMRISRTSLLRWDQLYRTASDLIHLIDARGGDQSSKGDAAAWQFFKERFLDERAPKLAKVWREARRFAQDNGLVWCSLTSCRRRLDEMIPPEVQAFHRDPETWRNSFRPTIAQDAERFAAGRCWVGDHSQLDFWVRAAPGSSAGGRILRPWLTTWQDWRTRRIVGWVMTDSPSSDTILAALRHGLLDDVNMGGPSEVIVDNGKDYDAWMWDGQTKAQRKRRVLDKGYLEESQFNGIFGLLGIEAHYSIAYNPNGKARMERWFGTLHDDFDRSMPTYCGSTPVERPEDLNQRLAERRNVPTWQHALERLTDWIAAYNARAEHQIDDLAQDGIRLSPDQAMAAWCHTRRVYDSTSLDLLLQHWHKPVTPGPKGVTISPYGASISYGQFDPAIVALKGTGKQVYVAWDPHDLRQVQVYDEKLRLLTVVPANEFGGVRDKVGRDRLSALMRQKRQHAAALKAVVKNRHLEYLTLGEQVRHDPPPPATPESPDAPEAPESEPNPYKLQLVQTPLDGQSNDPQTVQMRKAAGAEHQPDIDLADLLKAETPKHDDPIDVVDLDLSLAMVADDDDDMDVELDLTGDADEDDRDPPANLLDQLQ